MKKQLTLLGVFAHPDDESFGPGGTLARYAGEGRNVHVIIATDGIAGSVEDVSKLSSHETLAQIRSAELSGAAVALGVTTIWSLPIATVACVIRKQTSIRMPFIRQPIEKLTQEMVDYIERLQPDVVLTHDPFGGYGHPDHIRCCEAVTAAFHLVRSRSQQRQQGWAPQKLYYTAFDKRLLKFVVRVMPFFRQDPSKIGRNQDINLIEISRWETPVHAKVNVKQYLPQKQAASIAHASQYGGGPAFMRFLPKVLRQRFLEHEVFTRAYPAPNGKVEQDLFANIVP
ncbi:MAG: PIG-L deacetylase family protein [Caldilineaceae bacterium]